MMVPIHADWFLVDRNATTGRLYKTTRSGYAPTRFEYDALGDVKRTGLDVDDNGLVTASNDRIEENETLLNGLPVRTLDVNGLLNTTEYDGLMRVAEVIDSRGNSTRTAYYSGSTLKQSVPDAANHAVATFGYDTSGGVVWQADALGHATRPSYTLRGKLHRTWGGEADPVEYGFDATYGDRVSQSTFSGGTGWDGATWAGSPGTADNTTWTLSCRHGCSRDLREMLVKVSLSDWRHRLPITPLRRHY